MRTSASTKFRASDRRVFGYEPPLTMDPVRRRFVAYFFFVGWDCLSVGVHVALCSPNVEVHVPFGFFRVGWQMR